MGRVGKRGDTLTTVCWFRRDLRVADNPALTAAAAEGPVVALFVVDEVLRAQGAATRWRLEGALEALAADLAARGGALVVRTGDAAEVVAQVAAEVDADEVHANDWPEPSRIASDRRVAARLTGDGRQLILHCGHLLVPPHEIRTGSGGVYKVYTPFARAVRRHGVPAPLPVPKLDWADPPASEPLPDMAADMNRGADVLARHAPQAGEAAALKRLDAFLGRTEGYTQRDRPDRPDATSGLSDALAVGEISPRTIWAAAERHLHDPARAQAAEKFLAELTWRDFAWHLLTEWPTLPAKEWRADFAAFPFRRDKADETAWTRAITGEPLVDAGLREMFVTGRMHNRVRLAVASYLTKHLLIDWRVGLHWFADALIDWDPASNAMNWQWVAGSGPDASPYFRVFNPATQAAKFDPKGDYRRRWLWGWDGSDSDDARDYFEAVPRSWGMEPGDGYPDAAIVDLAEGRQRALDALATMRMAQPDADADADEEE